MIKWILAARLCDPTRRTNKKLPETVTANR